jgi:beta-galactosidase
VTEQPHAQQGSARRMDRLRQRVPGIGYGGDYNPEQWTKDVWAEDMRLMRDAGVSLVSLGIFSWAKVEPRPGDFDFGWVDTIMDMLADNGVAVSLATMTASPPPWLAKLDPESLPMRADGTRLWPGGRQHYCPSSPTYRSHAARLVEQLATRYGNHPALALWHIGNEYGCHVSQCCCDVSAVAFRAWLRNRYGNLDALNDAWSTTFWSQQYSEWDEVLPPRAVPAIANPAQQVDFARFSSDELLACYLTEKKILDRITPDVPATTNFLSAWKPLDFFAWAPYLDVASHDSYPDPHQPDIAATAFSYDLMRSLRGGQPWLLMEQAPSAVNWRDRNGPKPPGWMRLWSWQAVAHGADSVLFFQWRQSRGGAEKYHSAMVPHGGEDTRTHREVQALGRELANHAELVGSRLQADVALVMDWSSWWGLELSSHPSSDVTLLETVLAHYRPLYEANITSDVVHPLADLSAYRMVVVPNLYMVDDAAAVNLERYVSDGGTLVMSFFSGIVDTNDRVHAGSYPGPFRRLLGLCVEEFWPLPERGSIGLDLEPALAGEVGATGTPTGTIWSELVHLEGAEALGHFDGGVLGGSPALTRNRIGAGTAWYLATRPAAGTMRRIIRVVCDAAGVEPCLPDLPDSVQARTRHLEDGSTRHVLLNHSDGAVSVPLPGPMKDELGGGEPASSLDLPPRGVALLRPTPGPQ